MTTSKFLRNEEGCNNGHGTLSNAYHCTFHSTKHLCANATDEKHDQYRLIGTLLRSVLSQGHLLAARQYDITEVSEKFHTRIFNELLSENVPFWCLKAFIVNVAAKSAQSTIFPDEMLPDISRSSCKGLLKKM